MKIIRVLFVSITLLAMSVSWGCQMAALMSKPTRFEKKIPAEYKLKSQADKKLLVLVNQPSWLAAPPGLSEKLTQYMYVKLIANKITKNTSTIPYEDIAALRDKNPDFFAVYPQSAGQSLNADIVLYVVIDQVQLSGVQQNEYYKGLLAGRTQLIDVNSGDILWPDSPDGKGIKIEFDAEKGGYDASVKRMAASFVHCVVRYLYDCPVAQFQIFDDKGQSGWRQWED